MKKLHIKTYGCQMNVYDSARMADLLAPLGYAPSETIEGADMVILNTCHIREKAAEKVYSELGRLNRMKRERTESGAAPLLLAVAGCVAQAEGAEIIARQPAVDIVVGPQSYHRLPELIARRAREEGAVLETDFPAEDKFDHLPEQRSERGPAAFLTVQEGCDKFCTFCVVPYTRGAEYSRPAAEIAAEAEGLMAQGVREITLLGQNVNAYRGAGPDGARWTLARLIRHLARLGVERLRYTTSHPCDMGDDLIAAHGEVRALMPYLHLPVQSGSDRILKAMNRGHTREEYFTLARRIREARPDLALSSDFIVGYPGETEEDFEETLDLVRRVGFAQSYSFKYSARPGTPASQAARQVPERVKDARLQALQALLAGQQRAFARTCRGRVFPVLLEKPGRKPGQAVGRSPYLQPVHVDGAASRIGEIHAVEIADVLPNSLKGVLAGDVLAGAGAALAL